MVLCMYKEKGEVKVRHTKPIEEESQLQFFRQKTEWRELKCKMQKSIQEIFF